MIKRYFPIAMIVLLCAFCVAGGSWAHKFWDQSRAKRPVSALVVYLCEDEYFGAALTLADGTILPLPAETFPEARVAQIVKPLGREHVGVMIACSEGSDADEHTYGTVRYAH